MNPDPPFDPADDLPVYDGESDAGYSIEVIAELAGVTPRTILHYQEQGFIRRGIRDSVAKSPFDAETLRELRRIEHLRATCEMNDAGLKLLLDLIREVEGLREERRQRSR